MTKSKKQKSVDVLDIEKGTISKEKKGKKKHGEEEKPIIPKKTIEPLMVELRFNEEEEKTMKNLLVLMDNEESNFSKNLIQSVKDINWQKGRITHSKAQQIAVLIIKYKNSIPRKTNEILKITADMVKTKEIEDYTKISDKLLKFSNTRACMVCRCDLNENNTIKIILIEGESRKEKEICKADFESKEFNEHFKKCSVCNSFAQKEEITEEINKNWCKFCKTERDLMYT